MYIKGANVLDGVELKKNVTSAAIKNVAVARGFCI